MGLTLKGTMLRIERAATCRQWIHHECHVWRQKELYFSWLLWLGLWFWHYCELKILWSDVYRLDLHPPDAGTPDPVETWGSAQSRWVGRGGRRGGTCPPAAQVPRATHVSRGGDRQGHVPPTPIHGKRDGDRGCPGAFPGVTRESHKLTTHHWKSVCACRSLRSR